jgi:hypothetical protein
MDRYGGRAAVTRASALAGLALVLSSCGGGSESGADQSTPSPAAPSSSTSSDSPSESPSEPEPTPTVEPASGPTLEVGTIRVSAPAKFKRIYDTPFVDVAQGMARDGLSGGVLLNVVADDEVGLRSALKDSFNQGTTPEQFQRQDDTELGGQPAYYYTMRETRFIRTHVIGRWDSGYLVHVDVSLPVDMPMAQQQEIVESVRVTYDSPSS